MTAAETIATKQGALSDLEVYELCLRIMLEEEAQLELAQEHPKWLLQFVECVDSRTGEHFQFELLTEAEAREVGAPVRGTRFEYPDVDDEVGTKDWSWQRPYLEWILENDQTITLKGRQLGVTWIWAGLALWYLLFRPGSDVLIYSIKEEDAVEVVNRIWDMYLSLPAHFKDQGRVIKPIRGIRPSTKIEFEHTDGRVSSISAMVSTEHAGHSRSAALVIFDEASRQEHARDLWKAVVPAAGDAGGKIGVVSTANGMSDGRGLGNFFHELWLGAGYSNYPHLKKVFLGWWFHPQRDAAWYESVSLDESSKAEQYPHNPDEAFLMSGSPYFDTAALKEYAKTVPNPLFRARWVTDPRNPAKATLAKGDEQPIEIFQLPERDRKYAIGLDNATGHGTDFSVAAVIDLHSGAPVAEMHMKGDHDVVAEQVHFLGLWYNTARIAPEKQGGYGDTVIAYLRDGHKGRKPYSKLYRHRRLDRAGGHESTQFGMPMNQQTRPKIVSELRIWLDERLFPYVTRGFLAEARTFVRRSSGTSPRAADGCNDDRVMAWGIALELFSLYGEHEHDRRKKTVEKVKKQKKESVPLYPW